MVEPDAGDVVGTAGNETLTGTPGDDRIFGAGGATNDSLTIDYSGSPQAIAIDLLRATAEGGHAEGDVLVLINVIISTDFDDVLLADSSVTELRGGPGNDVLAAPSDNGVIVPILTLIGGTGGDDQLLSGDGDDLLIEDADLGTLDAGPGSDLLVAVASAAGTSAVLTGGGDDDLFIIATDLDGGASLDVTATITDFDQGTDRIDLSDLRNADGAVLDLADILVDAQVANGDTVIDLANYQSSSGQQMTGTVTLTGVANPNSLIAADFVFSAGTDWEALLPTDLVV